MSELYSIYDVVAQKYAFLGEFDHPRSAIEHFNHIYSRISVYGFKRDLFLVSVGRYDSDSGEVIAYEKPVHIARCDSLESFQGENEIFSPETLQNNKSKCKAKSQVSKHINLAKQWFYAVLITLLFAVLAIALCACTAPFINVERIDHHASVL